MFEIINAFRKIENDLKEKIQNLRGFLEIKMEKNLNLVKENYNILYKKAQQQENTTKDSEMNLVNLSKKHKKKSKRRANPNKIRSSLSKYQEKLAIMDKIFPKSDENPIFNQNSLQSLTNSKEKDKGKEKTLKVLSFQKKEGIFVRGKFIDPDNPQDIEKKFYSLGYGDIISLNKKKISHLPIINISDIKEKDPYQWGREQAMFQNQGKINIMRLYTRKLLVVSAAKKEIGVNIHFQKKINENIKVNLGKSVQGMDESLGKSINKGLGMTFKQKKQMKREKKNVDSMSLFSFEDLKDKNK